MRRESILMIWVGGFVLAILLYLVGPDRFFDVCVDLVNSIDAGFRNIVAALGAQTYGAVRALALAIYAVFTVLAFLATQRGHRGIGAWIVVSGLFLILIWRPYDAYPAPISRWIVALGLVIAGAGIMTQRLIVSPLRREGSPPPYPPGGRLP